MASLLNRVKALPSGFVWGGATAAYQVEGNTAADGRGACLWDVYLKEKGTYSPEPACDFYHQYPVDIALAQQHGLNALRLSISWTRIFPDGDPEKSPNTAGVEYYHNLFSDCLEHGIQPYVALHHFDSPQSNLETGDWLNPENIERFVAYARFCFTEFDEVENWFTINEPLTLSMDQYIYGGFPPCHHFDFSSAIQVQHNLCYAHARAVNVFHELGHKGRIGIVHIVKPIYPIVDTPENRHATELFDTLYNRILLDGTLSGEYSEATLDLVEEIARANDAEYEFPEAEIEEMRIAAARNDMLGVNYYQNMFAQAYDGDNTSHHNGTGEKGTLVMRLKGVGQAVKNPDIPTTDWDWNIFPQGLEDALKRVHADYPNCPTMYVTENGIGLKEALDSPQDVLDDPARIDYIDAHVEALLKARDAGVDVQGYFVWSLQDQFSWTNGYSKRYGLFYVDFETQKRTVKSSALWFKELADTMNPVE